jgi:hypothetical protein
MINYGSIAMLFLSMIMAVVYVNAGEKYIGYVVFYIGLALVNTMFVIFPFIRG